MAAENGQASPEQALSIAYQHVNSLKHVFEALDEADDGKVGKEELQVVCANVARVGKVTYNTEDLAKYKEEEETLTFPNFMDYVKEELLSKANLDGIDFQELDKSCWGILAQKHMTGDEHTFTEDQALSLWLIFNKLDIDSELKVDKEEIKIILEKFLTQMGVNWNPVHVDEHVEGDELTFWQFLECVEKKYTTGLDKSVCDEALDDLLDSFVREVIKKGRLSKKGHMVRSVKERWFILKPDSLNYYTGSDPKATKKGTIMINTSSKVEGIPDKGQHKCRLMISCGKKGTGYELAAENQRAKQAWINAIQQAIDTSGGKSALMKELEERKAARAEHRRILMEEEKERQEKEELLKRQGEDIDHLKQMCADAEATAEEEAARLREEIKKREELEELQKDLENLLETERQARDEEAKMKERQEQLYKEEAQKREEIEMMRKKQAEELDDERRLRENIEGKQKEQERLLEEERLKLEQLATERKAAEEAAQEALAKLQAAEEAANKAAEEAKKKTREIKTPIGLARPIQPSVKGYVTHRGQGAFAPSDFAKWEITGSHRPGEIVNRPADADDEPRAQIIEESTSVTDILSRIRSNSVGKDEKPKVKKEPPEVKPRNKNLKPANKDKPAAEDGGAPESPRSENGDEKSTEAETKDESETTPQATETQETEKPHESVEPSDEAMENAEPEKDEPCENGTVPSEATAATEDVEVKSDETGGEGEVVPSVGAAEKEESSEEEEEAKVEEKEEDTKGKDPSEEEVAGDEEVSQINTEETKETLEKEGSPSDETAQDVEEVSESAVGEGEVATQEKEIQTDETSEDAETTALGDDDDDDDDAHETDENVEGKETEHSVEQAIDNKQKESLDKPEDTGATDADQS